MSPQYSGFAVLPHPTDTREREARAVLDLAQRHVGVIVTAEPGEGRRYVARNAAALAGLRELPTLDCGASTTPERLHSWLRANDDSPFVLLRNPDLLASECVPVIDAAFAASRTVLLFTCAPSVLHAESQDSATSVAAFLADRRRRHQLAHLELGPLSAVELARVAEKSLRTSALDTMQLHSICLGAQGSAALVTALATDADGRSEHVSRHLSASWNEGFPLSSTTRARIAERLRALPDDLISAVASIQGLGTLDIDTAATLLGHDVVTRLMAAELVFSPTPDTIDVSSFVRAALPADAVREAAVDKVLRRLERAYRFEPALPPGCLLALAEHRIMSDDLGPAPALYVAAAQAAIRFGHGRKALKFLRVAQELGETSSTVAVAWHARLLLDEHQGVLEEAEALYAVDPDGLTVDHLHAVIVAASWMHEVPAWLGKVFDALPDELAEICGVLLQRQPLDGPAARRLLRVAKDPASPLTIRRAAFSIVLWEQFNASDHVALAPTIELARTFAGSQPRRVHFQESQSEYEARLTFELILAACKLLTGNNPDRVRKTAEVRIVAALGYGPDSGVLSSTIASFMSALVWHSVGDFKAAARDLAVASAGMNRTLLRSVNDLLSSFFDLLPERLAPHEAETIGRLHYLTQPSGAPLQQRPAQLPEWLIAESGLDEVRGLGDKALAHASAILHGVHWPSFPAPLAIRDYLAAKVAQDPDQLRGTVEALVETGQMTSALDALTCAREIHLQRRSTVAAMECAEVLQRFLPVDATGVNEPRQRRGTRRRRQVVIPAQDRTPPSGLSERELQVCLLVAEGLTNAEIAHRLVLSTRTVESHVLQSRSKLNAKRRADLPNRLRLAWERKA
ncbi:MAG: LuxR C-terminal-related transcriptional regulator [Galactobacter sp.]